MKGNKFYLATNAFTRWKQTIFSFFFLWPKLFLPNGVITYCSSIQIRHFVFRVSTTLPNYSHALPSRRTHLHAQAQYFAISSLTPLLNPPRAALKSNICTLSPLLLPACTHASHCLELETTGLRYRLEAKFRSERDSTKI